MFLTLIRLLTRPPFECALTGPGSRVYPNNQGSRVYPNGQGSRVYPNGWGSRVYPKGRGNRVYTNGQGSRAWPGQGRRCARASPLWLALRARGSGYVLVAWASPSWFALHGHGSGFALTTIKWIHLLQLNELIYFALQKIYEFIRIVYQIGIFRSVLVSIFWYLPYQYQRKSWSVHFGIIFFAETPFPSKREYWPPFWGKKGALALFWYSQPPFCGKKEFPPN